MIKNNVYSPYLQRCIFVCVPDIETLETYAITAGKVRNSIPDACEMWHVWDAFTDAFLVTLDEERRRENAI